MPTLQKPLAIQIRQYYLSRRLQQKHLGTSNSALGNHTLPRPLLRARFDRNN